MHGFRHPFKLLEPKRLALPLWLGACSLSPAFAQALPDAGRLEQPNSRNPIEALPRPVPPPLATPRPPLSVPQGTRIEVRAFRLEGNTLLSQAQLQHAVQAYTGRTLGFSELQEATQAVVAAYREAGWMVRAYLPRQDVTEGTVTIQVVEALFGGARLEGNAPQRYSADAVIQRFRAQQEAGKPLQLDALDRALLLADDLPGVAVSGVLSPGPLEGQTELLLKMSDEMVLAGEVALDNTGSRSTASDRASLNLIVSSPLRMADQLSLNLVHTHGSDYGRVAWSFPLGYDGLRMGVNASHMDYRLLATEFEALQGVGSSASQGLELTYPLLRSRQRNVYLSLAHDAKHYKNSANRATQSDYRLNEWTWGLNANLFDTLGGGGANSAARAWTAGQLDQGPLDVAESRALAGSFDKLRYSLSRQQTLGNSWSLYAALSGQQSTKELDSSERMYLGGASGVRAYPASEGGGSRGHLLNLELRWRLPDSWVLTSFYDMGQVSSVDAGSSTRLAGFGLGLNWNSPWGFDFKGVWARRDGSNPNPASSGQDQDGTLVRDRLWFTLTLPLSRASGK